jgi:hypothetical protein
LVAAAGLAHPRDLRPSHIMKRISPSEVRSFAEVYPFLASGELIAGTRNADYAAAWDKPKRATSRQGCRSRSPPARAA